MHTCLLCGDPTGLRAIGAMVLVDEGNPPEGAVVCRRCTALPEAEQERRRDAALLRRRERAASP
jgi:hypothetical protein